MDGRKATPISWRGRRASHQPGHVDGLHL